VLALRAKEEGVTLDIFTRGRDMNNPLLRALFVGFAALIGVVAAALMLIGLSPLLALAVLLFVVALTCALTLLLLGLGAMIVAAAILTPLVALDEWLRRRDNTKRSHP
jgi:hypothetical protein